VPVTATSGALCGARSSSPSSLPEPCAFPHTNPRRWRKPFRRILFACNGHCPSRAHRARRISSTFARATQKQSAWQNFARIANDLANLNLADARRRVCFHIVQQRAQFINRFRTGLGTAGFRCPPYIGNRLGSVLEVSSIESTARKQPAPFIFYRFELLCGFAEFAGLRRGRPKLHCNLVPRFTSTDGWRLFRCKIAATSTGSSPNRKHISVTSRIVFPAKSGTVSRRPRPRPSSPRPRRFRFGNLRQRCVRGTSSGPREIRGHKISSDCSRGSGVCRRLRSIADSMERRAEPQGRQHLLGYTFEDRGRHWRPRANRPANPSETKM